MGRLSPHQFDTFSAVCPRLTPFREDPMKGGDSMG